eukprot:388808_1
MNVVRHHWLRQYRSQLNRIMSFSSIASEPIISNSMLRTNDERKTLEMDSNEYDFRRGFPAYCLNLPSELVKKSMEEHINVENKNYYYHSTNSYPSFAGSIYFRDSLSDWLNRLSVLNKNDIYKGIQQISSQNMLLTTGASQCMELLLFHLKKMKIRKNKNCKNIILMEDPSYFLFPDIVQNYDCQIIPIPFTDTMTLDFNYLEKILIKYSDDIICFYMIPSHQNPLGINYSFNDRIKLIKLCHKYELHIIADEVYNLLSFNENEIMIPFLSSIEQSIYTNNEYFYCHSISSFSKIIGPGFRIGWIHSFNHKILDSIANHGSIKSGGCMAHFVPALIRYLLLNDDLINHLMNVRNKLNKNCTILCDTLQQNDHDNIIKFIKPTGGYFVWLELQNDCKFKLISCQNDNIKYFDGDALSSTFGPVAKNIQFSDFDFEDKTKNERQ